MEIANGLLWKWRLALRKTPSKEKEFPGNGRLMDVEKLLDNLVSLSEASIISGLSADHLRRLVENRKLWGVKIGHSWVTTRQAVEEYANQKHPRGPKPKTT